MTSQLIERAFNSRTKTRYIQPSLRIADNIVSHKIGPDAWLEIFQYFNTKTRTKPKPELVTTYFDQEQVLTVTNTTKNLHIIFRNDYFVFNNEPKRDLLPDPHKQPTLEFVGENSFELNISQFPVAYEYSHIRQSIVFKMIFEHFDMVFEVLVEGLNSYEDINHQLLKLPVEQLIREETIFSHSFRMYLKTKAEIDEIQEHLDTCIKILSCHNYDE